MTGILSQFITIVTYGNDYLMNGKIQEDFYPSHPAFKFCDRVYFNDMQETQEKIIADNPFGWFQYLKETGCKKLRLYFSYSGNEQFPDYKSAGMVGGGGYWHMEADYDNGCDIWASRWQVTKENDPDRNIWAVDYGLFAEKQQPTAIPCNLDVIKKVSLERISAIAAFASEQQLDNWHSIFKNAYDILNSGQPAQNDYQRKMLPENNYSLIARQLLFAADAAWVFGGMGSWNDLSFNDNNIQQQYEQLSYNLYDNICVNVIASVNSY